jgi:hypothetical protein
MAVRALAPGIVASPPAPPVTRPAPELATPTALQIMIAKQRIVALASQQAYVQTIRNELEAGLAALDQTTVSAVSVSGYPPKESFR